MKAPGKRAVITGGEGDLARAIGAHLTHHGFEIKSPGRDRLDVTDDDQVRQYLAQHQPDLLVCNAGITRDQGLGNLSEKNWDDVINVNLKGAIRCSLAVIESMKDRGGGSIILLSSYSALHPPAGQTAYATAKAALLGFVDELAHEYGEYNIRVNAILPGFMETKMTDSVREQRREEVIAAHALKRPNTPDRLAEFIRLLHLEMLHTSGQSFQLDSRNPF